MQSKRCLHFLATMLLIVGVGYAARGASALVINEIMYDLPGSDDPHEWIEIYNDASQSVMVATGTNGWRFSDGTNHLINSPAQGSATLGPGAFAILADDASTFLQDHAGFSGTVFDSVMSLANTTDTLRLSDENGVLLHEITYASASGAAGNGKTLEWQSDGSWHESASDGGTPGALNSALPSQSPSLSPTPSPSPTPQPSLSPTPTAEPTPTLPILSPTPSEEQNRGSSISQPSPSGSGEIGTTPSLPKIHINEFLPNTTGIDSDEEWVEVWNEGDDIADISGWTLDDTDGGSPPYTISQSTAIPAGSFLILKRTVTGIALNNDVDVVRLLTPTGQLYESVSYEKPPKGASSNRTAQGSFVWSWTPTPGLPNVITIENSTGGGAPSKTTSPQITPSISVSTTPSTNSDKEDPIKPTTAKTAYAKPPIDTPGKAPQSFAAGQESADETRSAKTSATGSSLSPQAGSNSSPQAGSLLGAQLAVSVPPPYRSFFERYALMLSAIGALGVILALLRWRRKLGT